MFNVLRAIAESAVRRASSQLVMFPLSVRSEEGQRDGVLMSWCWSRGWKQMEME